jgi:hypothetical protein
VALQYAIFNECHLYVCGVQHCPASPESEQRIAEFSGVQSNPTFRPTYGGRTESRVGGRSVCPLWSQIVTIWKHSWVESLQCQMARVEVSQCLIRGWTNHQSTGN